MSVVDVHRLAAGYRTRRRVVEVLTAIDLTLSAGELVCLLGPNGSGKTTLLRTLAGMLDPLAGEVRIDGDDVTRLPPMRLARRLALVTTDRVDVGLLTAYDLVALGRHPRTDWLGRLTEHDHRVVRWALASTGAVDLADREVVELSDGQRQRVMIARALAQEPRLLLLDEPTAFVDLPRRVELTGLLRSLARGTGVAIVVATHDLELALRTSDTIWLLDDAGNLHVGAPEDLVLDGTLAATFATDELVFDPQTGGFRVRQVSTARAVVHGVGARRRWTAHALEREGFEIVTDAALADLEVHVDDDAWTALGSGGPVRATTIRDLLAGIAGTAPLDSPVNEPG